MRSSLADFLFLDQPEVAADVEPEVPREEPGHPLHIKRTIRLVGAGVGRSLHDPDLARASVRVVQAAAVAHRNDVVGAAVDEEQGPRLERAQHSLRTRLGKLRTRSHAEHHAGQPYEGRAGQLDRSPHVLGQDRAQLAERAVEDERLHAGLAGGAEQGHHRAHGVTEEADPGVGNALASECDDRLQLQHLLDPERDGRAITPWPAAIGVEDDVEALAPKRRRDPQRTLALPFVAAGHDHRLRRSRLPEVPRPEVDAVRGDELHLLVVGLELEGREGEVVKRTGLRRHESPAIQEIGRGDIEDQECGGNQHEIRHRKLNRSLRLHSKTRVRAYSSSGTRRVSRMTSAIGTTSTSPLRRIGITPLRPAPISSTARTPRRVAQMRSVGVGEPPRWRWPSTVTRVSKPVSTSTRLANASPMPRLASCTWPNASVSTWLAASCSSSGMCAPSATTMMLKSLPSPRRRYRWLTTSPRVSGNSGMMIRSAPPATPPKRATQPVSRPITSTTITRWCADAVVWSRSRASVTTPTAVSKPMQNSVTLRSLSIVLGTPTV